MLTVEGRIILHLEQNGETRVKELMIATGVSYRGFYLGLDRLKKKGVVATRKDPSDGRARIVHLLPELATARG